MKLLAKSPVVSMLIPYPFLDIAPVVGAILVDEKSSLCSSMEFSRMYSSHTIAIPTVYGLGAFGRVGRRSNHAYCSYGFCVEGAIATIESIIEGVEVAFFPEKAIFFNVKDTGLNSAIS